MSYDPFMTPAPSARIPDVPTPPKPFNPWLAAAIGIVIGLVWGAGFGVAGTLILDDDEPETTSSSSETDDDLDEERESAESALDRELPALIEFVEEERGLTFNEEVELTFLDDDDFDAALMDASTEGGPQAGESDEYAQTYAALQLTRDAESYLEAENEGFLAGVTGYYDTATEEIVVRGTTWNPMVEATLVHELTHALQDQHFDLDRLTEVTRLDDESYIGISAIIEGDASRVEYEYYEKQSSDWSDAYDEEFNSFGLDADFDAAAEAWGALPYDLGSTAVDQLFELGGNEAVDAAFRASPRSTEQLADVEAWSDDETEAADPVAVAAPKAPAGAKVVDGGTLGVFGLGLLPQYDDGYFYVEEYLEGWAGDRYTTWLQADERPCTAVSVVFDDAASVDEALDVLEPWVDEDDTEATRVGASGLTLTSCGRAS